MKNYRNDILTSAYMLCAVELPRIAVIEAGGTQVIESASLPDVPGFAPYPVSLDRLVFSRQGEVVEEISWFLGPKLFEDVKLEAAEVLVDGQGFFVSAGNEATDYEDDFARTIARLLRPTVKHTHVICMKDYEDKRRSKSRA
jgi:hypothetical protein